MRRDFTQAVKREVWTRASGCCEECGLPIGSKRKVYDHVRPDALGGEPTAANARLLCGPCDDLKTAADRKRITKAYRQHAAHIGAKPKGRPMPGSKASGWKHTMAGQWERRT